MYKYSILKSEFNNYDLSVNDICIKIEQTHDNNTINPEEVYENAELYYMYTFEERTPAFFTAKLMAYFDKIVNNYKDLGSRALNLLVIENNKLLQESEDIER